MSGPTDRRTPFAIEERDACGVGLVAERSGRPSARVLPLALTALRRLAHRGAVDADGRSGDGAGVLTALPEPILRGSLPQGAREGTSPLAAATLFVPRADGARAAAEGLVERTLSQLGLALAGWREVPLDESVLGLRARASRPLILQALILRPHAVGERDFDERLLDVRMRLTAHSRGELVVASCSAATTIYKGLVRPEDLSRLYPDLRDPLFRTPFAILHQRFSTNTAASWDRAQPFPMLAHNGEINTVTGNRAWMRARLRGLARARGVSPDAFDEPSASAGQSDSASLDDALARLVASGRTLPQAMRLLVPAAWEKDPTLPPELRADLESTSARMEPWDGPAFVVFTDGRTVGATLDRNGLRPARYWVTEDGLVAVASETGVFDVSEASVVESGRLGPGDVLAVSLRSGRIRMRPDVDRDLARARSTEPRRPTMRLSDVAASVMETGAEVVDEPVLRTFGATREELRLVYGPMAHEGREPMGSMGDDTPFAALSSRPRLLSDYFRQRFAQVTNPPIDSLREAVVMSLRLRLGPRENVLGSAPARGAAFDLATPLVTPEELSLLAAHREGWSAARLPLLFDASGGADAFEAALEALLNGASAAVSTGATLLVLDDRGVGPGRAALPALLAVSAVHQRLVRDGLRLEASLAVAAGEARTDHQVATLLAFGAEAVCPWIPFALLRERAAGPDAAGEARYRAALEKGLLKILAKMGISTMRSYVGSQMFEALGLSRELVEAHFTGTTSLLGGLVLRDLAHETLERHRAAFVEGRLDEGGNLGYRRSGETHAYAPAVVRALRDASVATEPETFGRFTAVAEARPPVNLRDLLEVEERDPIGIDEVEGEDAILSRFMTAGMSLGALSPEAHEALAAATAVGPFRSNSGEGGEDGARNAIKQVASARFGVTARYLVSAEELQIKIAQGSKPGEGGQLPGRKTVGPIARVRHAPEGTTLISPPPHHDIYSIEDLAQLVHDLKRVNPSARVGVKLVSQSGVGTVATGVAKAHADAIVIGGHDGGTGASPIGSIKHAGTPWELGLAEAHHALVDNGLRHRLRLQVEGGIKTGRDVVVAALLGAEEFGFGTGALVALGCVMARQCHLDTCPAGIATQREDLRARFRGRPEDVVRYLRGVARHVREILAALGAPRLEDVVGRADLLRARPGLAGKPASLDLSALLRRAEPYRARPLASRRNEPPRTGSGLDESVLAEMRWLASGPAPLRARRRIENADRSVGARLSGEIARRHPGPLPPGTVTVEYRGHAGQSFGAFAVDGVSLRLEGAANDYVAKGLSGGEVVVRPFPGSAAPPVLAGNAVLYGATSGTLLVAGRAGDRFAVRNSGAAAVVEGLGDHGCEYMTAGTVVVLGSVGRNFGAGMSGGVAYLLDGFGEAEHRINSDLVGTGPVPRTEADGLRELLELHRERTGSRIAFALLHEWPQARGRFQRVAPREATPERSEPIEERELGAAAPARVG